MGLNKHKIINSKYLHKQFYKNLIFCYIFRSNEKDPVIMLTKTQDTPKDLCKEKITTTQAIDSQHLLFLMCTRCFCKLLSITYNSH